jgi:bidirectional [NiFe] hydrogenase diaphorase subunit
MTSDNLLEVQQAELRRQAKLENRLSVCMVAGCLSSGARQVRNELQQEIARQGKEGRAEVCGGGCLGWCSRGPMVHHAAANCTLTEVQPADAAGLVRGDLGRFENRRLTADHPFYAHQKRIILANSSRVDPESISTYIAAGGYQALLKAISEMTPHEVLQQVKLSGLRGRGGAGYPTGVKWELVARHESPTKYVVCNADEGDPGAFMNRSVLEGDPHRVLEGMAIAGLVTGASQGYVYVRGESPLAVERLKTAIRQAEREGLLGGRIFDYGFQFRIDIRIGAGAYVCGEETALIASMEGQRGQPRPRPPYPGERGLWGQPTLINNVETLAAIPDIIRNGGAWYADIGTPTSPGTKVFALAGRVRRTGLAEVPLGTPLRTILEDIGGGVPEGYEFKAAQTGGPAGGCIPAAHLDVPMDYDSLRGIGSMMGSGGLIVLDTSTSMVDLARFFMEFCMDESCGKCIPCRAGTVQMHGILQRLVERRGRPADLAMLEELGGLMRQASLCGLGQAAPNPVLSTLRHFRAEYGRSIREEQS